MPIILAAIDELVGSVGRHIGDLNGVIDLVVHFTIGALRPRDLAGWDAAQVRLDFDELSHAFCGQLQTANV